MRDITGLVACQRVYEVALGCASSLVCLPGILFWIRENLRHSQPFFNQPFSETLSPIFDISFLITPLLNYEFSEKDSAFLIIKNLDKSHQFFVYLFYG